MGWCQISNANTYINQFPEWQTVAFCFCVVYYKGFRAGKRPGAWQGSCSMSVETE